MNKNEKLVMAGFIVIRISDDKSGPNLEYFVDGEWETKRLPFKSKAARRRFVDKLLENDRIVESRFGERASFRGSDHLKMVMAGITIIRARDRGDFLNNENTSHTIAMQVQRQPEWHAFKTVGVVVYFIDDADRRLTMNYLLADSSTIED